MDGAGDGDDDEAGADVCPDVPGEVLDEFHVVRLLEVAVGRRIVTVAATMALCASGVTPGANARDDPAASLGDATTAGGVGSSVVVVLGLVVVLSLMVLAVVTLLVAAVSIGGGPDELVTLGIVVGATVAAVVVLAVIVGAV